MTTPDDATSMKKAPLRAWLFNRCVIGPGNQSPSGTLFIQTKPCFRTDFISQIT